MHAFTPSMILSGLPAPMFWPQNVVMAMPRLSSATMNSILMRIPAAKPATNTVPRALFELWIMMLPMAVMENCSPIGTPTPSSCAADSLSNLRSSGHSRRTS